MTRSSDEQQKTAGGATDAATASLESAPVPVTGPPKLRSEHGEPLCGNSRCRKPLPAGGGPGRKHDYCPEKATVWPDSTGKNRTCNDLGTAERLLFDIYGVTAAEVPADFFSRLDAVLGPVEVLQQTSGALLSGLGGIREQLATAVRTAEQERDRALAAEADAKGRAEISDEKAQEAFEERDRAIERADTAEDAADDSRKARDRALADKERAEGRAAELVKAQEREAERMAGLIARVERAEIDLATRTTERNSAREERAAEKQRAEDAEAANIVLERALRDEFRQELERRAEQQQRELVAARDDYDRRLEQIRADNDAALQRVRAEADGLLQGVRAEAEAARVPLIQELGALGQRAATAESDRDRQATRARDLRSALGTVLAVAGESADELREQLQHLLDNNDA
ncbi:MAG: hypothetical protein QOF58_1714 [Pseudonocardiales bacterium]|nr:hypothetical protein [Pseudonocardiales bacterium]